MNTFKTNMLEIEKHRDEVIEKLVQFSMTDTLMFWGNEKDLIEEQEQAWTPILKWCEKTLSTHIETTNTLNVPETTIESGYRVKNFLYSLSSQELTVFYKSALLMKSVMLAMAFTKKFITAEQAFKAAYLEEIWQNQSWGTTEETEKQREALKTELYELAEFLDENSPAKV